MGYHKLYLLMLLSSYSLAQQDNGSKENPSTCLFTSRFKVNKKYIYQYITESRNGAVGTANLKNGLKVTCQVEIEVPQICGFVMRTMDCTIAEVAAIDPHGQPVYKQSTGSGAFKAAMGRNPLKFSVQQISSVQLYPEPNEPVYIVNVKRGIISALIVPAADEEESSLQSTLHGQCLTERLVNAKKDFAVDVTLSRDLSQCDHFYGRERINSPLAFLQKLHRPLSELITSKQDCNYQFHEKERHIITATCKEKHTYLPFFAKDNGISSTVTQELSFHSYKRINNRVFDVDPSRKKPLYFENPEDKSPFQTKDAALRTLRDLQSLTGSDHGEKRTSLFYKLVSTLRNLRNETMNKTVTEMLRSSSWLTWQALLQCGTPECISGICQAIRSLDGLALEADALIYVLSLQENPDAARVRDMLSMTQYKQSKAIMYALGNTVKKFHQGNITPEVKAVSEFMWSLLNDCTGEMRDPEAMTFLVLRVVGVMGHAMQTVSPDLISSIMNCFKRSDISLSNKKAAIQAFRQMDIHDQIKDFLKEVYQDPRGHIEIRIAAYLILMKNPDLEFVTDIVTNMEVMEDDQLKNFVISHLKNIQSSNEPQMHQYKEYIELALQNRLLNPNEVIDGKSRNYKIESPVGSLSVNIIFDATNTLPKEVMLETTLKVFNYSYDIFEFCVEGTGLQPTIEALFGEDGFFPDSISRVLYWAGDQSPMIKEVLHKMALDKVANRRQISETLLNDIAKSVQKVMKDIYSSPIPEATAYLKLLGNEMYLKTSEIRKMAETLFMYFNVFFRVLPPQIIFELTQRTDNEVFIHFIFMENSFSFSTALGFPMKFSLAGVFAPGAKGGMTVTSSKGDLAFMPSIGLEFITQMTVHAADYAEAGLEMHTNMYHEHSLNATVTINRNQMRLSIPAPKSNTQLFSFSNKLVSVTSGQVMTAPSFAVDQTNSTDCQPLFRGLKICTVVHYSNTSSKNQAPSYPLTAETMAAVLIQPTDNVTEYTATIKRETLTEGKKGRHEIDSLRITLKAEGDDSTEATASVKYNRNKNILTGEVVIPNYDVQLGIRVAGVDSEVKQNNLRGISLEVTNKDIPQLTLVGSTRLELMKNAILRLQMLIPALKTNASFTATLKKHPDNIMNIETTIKLPETSYRQTASLKYDEEKFEVQSTSDLNSKIRQILPSLEGHQRKLKKLIENILDRKVAKTDMKLRHIVTKGIEATNIWLDKLTVSIPILKLMQNKRRLSEVIVPSLPERIFLQFDNSFRCKFNKDEMALSLPLPLGGKKSEQLNFPKSLSAPALDLPAIGLHLPSQIYRLPSFAVPPVIDFPVPLIGVAEASVKINSNFYRLEGSISAGNHTVDGPGYIVQYKARTNSPFNLLVHNLEGTWMMSGRGDDHLEYLVNNSLSHSLIQTRASFSDTLDVTNKLHAKANYKIEASSPLGLYTSFHYVAQSTSITDSGEVTGDGTWDGTLQIGSFYTNSSYSNGYKLNLQERKGRGESILRFDSPFLIIHNTIHGIYTNSGLNIVSETNAQKDIFHHVAELNYKDSQLTPKCTGVAKSGRKRLRNEFEFGVSNHNVIILAESKADDETNRAYHLINGSLNSRRLEVNSDGSLTFAEGRGLHKASIVFDRNGLTASGANSIQYSPVTFENIFSGSVDSNGASLSSTSKAMAEEGEGELNIEAKTTAKKAHFWGVFNGNVFSAHTRNNVNVQLDRRAFNFISSSMGKMGQMKTENSQTLTLTRWALALRSSSDALCEDFYYKQDSKIYLKPFVITLDATNELKCFNLTLSRKDSIKLKPLQAELSGFTRGSYGEEHIIKHTYELNHQAMAGKIQSNTSGNLWGGRFGQTCELEFAGLSSTYFCESHVESKLLHFDSTIRTQALPFVLSIDAFFNGDGEIDLYGKHTGQLYSKLLAKAEPSLVVCSHDSRVSTVHALSNWETSTQSDHKFDGFLLPSGQAVKWKIKSQLNNHSFEQNISAYNNRQKAVFEFSEVMLTDALRRWNENIGSKVERQEFSLTGFLQYDKSSNCHSIPTPFPFLAACQQLKNACVRALETLQRYINNQNIKQMISDFRVKVDRFPSQVSDFMTEMQLENKVDQIKEKLDYFMNGFDVTMDDLDVRMNNMIKDLENKAFDVAAKIRNLILSIDDYVKTRHVAEKLARVLNATENELRAFTEKYNIRGGLLEALKAIDNIAEQFDMEKLAGSSIAWLRALDSKSGIREKIRKTLADIWDKIESFDGRILFQQMNEFLLSTNLGIEKLLYEIPYTKIANVMESAKDVLVNWIDEYEVPSKLNAIYSYIRDHVSKYDLGDTFKEIIEQAAILIGKMKIAEGVRSFANALKVVDLEFVHDQIVQFLHSVKNHLSTIDVNKIMEELGGGSSALESLTDFDYRAFVNEANKNVAQLTNYINERIKTYEIVSKVEAVREFIRTIQRTIFSYVEKLRNTKVAESLKKLKHVMDSTIYVDVKMKVQDVIEDIRQRILDMDIGDEVHFYLQRASESYNNIVAFVSAKINQLIEEIGKLVTDNEILCRIKQTINGGLNIFKKVQIQVDSFTILFTDLVVPGFTINVNQLHEISVPAEISVPEFTILGSITVPALTISFDELKAKILAMIDSVKRFEMPAIDPDGIFGDLKVLYVFALPDVTFPEIRLSEIKVPTVTMPVLQTKDLEVTSLPMPGIKLTDTPHVNCVHVLGTFQGEFTLSSPVYTLATTGKIENSTSTPENPKFTATVQSQAKSTLRMMEYTFDAMAQLEAPGSKGLMFTEMLKASHLAFSIAHDASLVLGGSSAEVCAQTVSKAATSMYTADLVNSMTLSLRSGIFVNTSMSYKHNFDMPSMEISSLTSAKHDMASTVAGGIAWSGKTTARGKWSWGNYSDEGTHESTLELNINFNTTKLNFVSDTTRTALRTKQMLTLESVTFSHIITRAQCESEAPFVKSVIGANGEIHIWDLKVLLAARHQSQLSGPVTGSISNTLEFTSHSFESAYAVKNKATLKMVFPLKLSGKVELQHDYGAKFNSEEQGLYWIGSARFNQYKYNYNIEAEHNYMNVTFNFRAYGEANVDFLTVPFSIPAMNVPLLGIRTPEVQDVSLWEHAGLKRLLTTPQQSFAAHLKLTYDKNPNTQWFELHLEPVHISDSARIILAQFRQRSLPSRPDRTFYKIQT